MADINNITDRSMPLLISMDRSGSTWLSALAEVYFDQPRGPKQELSTYRPPKKGERFIFHTGKDQRKKQKPSQTECGDIMLIRNPVDTIYSYKSCGLMNEHGRTIESAAEHWAKLYSKWIKLASTIIIYERATEDPFYALQQFSAHFNKPWDKSRAEQAVKTCGHKSAIMGKHKKARYHQATNLSNNYANNRVAFRDKHHDKIWVVVNKNASDELKQFCETHFKEA